MARTAPHAPLMPKRSDVLSEICDLPSLLHDTTHSVPELFPLPSAPSLTARALRALHHDTLRTADDSTALSQLSVPNNRLAPPQQELPAKMPTSDCLKIVTSTQLSLNSQPSVACFTTTAFPCATCSSPMAPCATHSDIIAFILSRASPAAPLYTCALTIAPSMLYARPTSPILARAPPAPSQSCTLTMIAPVPGSVYPLVITAHSAPARAL